MNNSMNPYGGVNPLIDKIIGNAYDIVKYVAKYLREIRYVAENMEYVYVAANGNRTLLSQIADGTGAAFTIPLPVDMTTAYIESINVAAHYTGGIMTMPGSDTFRFSVSGGNVNIYPISADVSIRSATYKVTIIRTYVE
ncbi:MAG: hypothetical protein ABIR46_00755 [Candidatus Saccharimonadales bacterium]